MNHSKETIMAQAQVFASSWSMVGGPFDRGNEIKNAEAMKLELATMIEAVFQQRNELLSKVAAWEQKAANWMASPEAAQRLEGYRDIAQRLNVAEQQRDNLLAFVERV